jgi:hypothetical protein
MQDCTPIADHMSTVAEDRYGWGPTYGDNPASHQPADSYLRRAKKRVLQLSVREGGSVQHLLRSGV